MAFEENAEELATNVASLGFDLQQLEKDKKVQLDYVHIDKTEIEETVEYNLEGLFIRLGYAIDSIGVKRVVHRVASSLPVNSPRFLLQLIELLFSDRLFPFTKISN